MRRLASLIVPLVLLAGCGNIYVPGSSSGGTQPAAPPTAAVGQPLDVPTVTVKPGDTLYGIALANRVPMRGLIVLNRLEPPYRLSPGQQLVLPPQARLHTVVQGDTAYSIARRYGVTVADLAELNALDPPGRILLGQQLMIPGVELQQRLPTAPEQATAVAVTTERAIESEPLPPAATAPSASEIAALPSPSQPAAEPPTATPSESAPTTAAPEPPKPEPKPEPPKPAPARTVPKNGAPFLMPVDGKLLSGYGPKAGGLQNDGLNIAAARGAPVMAARDGTVVYAGNELPGFGNLVLVKHDEGWVTAYGHNETVLVKRGDTVRRGQTIATVGSTGNVTEPQLHFELRQGSRAIDPTPYVASGA